MKSQQIFFFQTCKMFPQDAMLFKILIVNLNKWTCPLKK